MTPNRAQKSPTRTNKVIRNRLPLAVRGFPPDLPNTAWLTLPEVLQYVPVSRTQWFRGVASGQLPRPHKVGRLAFWKARDIRVLLDMGPRAPRRTPHVPVTPPAAPAP
jgi:predicted DNA-binding transcriptional regulator AlpA